MKEETKLKIKIALWSFGFNPGAFILGFCAYSYASPRRAFPSFLELSYALYFCTALGVALLVIGGWRVNMLAKQLKYIKSDKT